MTREYIFTSESVSEGHPDKLCDQVSDRIVDLLIAEDPKARVAVECLATTNRMILAGEIRAQLQFSPNELQDRIEQAAREVVRGIGYDQEGFHWKNFQLDNYIHEQSPDIACGVDAGDDERGEGAGDQGIIFGYACDETPEQMPAPLVYAHQILQDLAKTRHNGETRLLPDAKSQVSLIYRDDRPVGVHRVLVSSQHREGVGQEELASLIEQHVRGVLPKEWGFSREKLIVNPTGKFVVGGPDGDTGLTGRKIVIDTYGGAAVHGGGAFSGKDSTKVDRSAAYFCRYLARNIVAAGLCRRCTIQVCYAIGQPRPLAVYVNCHSCKARRSNLEQELERWISDEIDLSPRGIISRLGLERPLYAPTASYGHFGRKAGEQGSFSWENLDLVETLGQKFL